VKTIVSVQELTELEIRPETLLRRFYELNEVDVRRLAAGPLEHVDCPACDATEGPVAFEKLGLTYRACPACGSLYVSPRPSRDALVAHHRGSVAARFWQGEILPATADVRAEKLVAPRAEWVLDGLAEHAPGARTGVDVSSSGGPLVDALVRIRGELRFTPVDARALAGAGRAFDIALAFDALDRAPDVPGFEAALADALRPGGLLFLAAPACGFELQVLWERSRAIFPVDKINVLTVRGLLRRFGPPRWDVLELSTPGMFDVEAVRRAVESDPSHPWPRFVRSLVDSGEAALTDLQEYLQRHRLASFARLLVRRRA
jgi:SAM-dependent methyltransferase